MHKFLMITFLSLFQFCAFAGTSECRPNIKLVCNLQFNQADGSFNLGPSLHDQVVDIQPEPFDPSYCEASLVFMTEVGKIVAIYSDDSHTVRAWMNSGAADKVLMNDTEISTTKSAAVVIPGKAGLGYESITLACTLN